MKQVNVEEVWERIQEETLKRVKAESSPKPPPHLPVSFLNMNLISLFYCIKRPC
jgi:hypothetical protein